MATGPPLRMTFQAARMRALSFVFPPDELRGNLEETPNFRGRKNPSGRIPLGAC